MPRFSRSSLSLSFFHRYCFDAIRNYIANLHSHTNACSLPILDAQQQQQRHHHYYIVANVRSSYQRTCVHIVRKYDQNRYLKIIPIILELLAIASNCIANECALLHHRIEFCHIFSRHSENFAHVFQYVCLSLSFFLCVCVCVYHLTQYRRQPNTWNTESIVALYSFLYTTPAKKSVFTSLHYQTLSILIFHTFVHTSVMILTLSALLFSNSMYSIHVSNNELVHEIVV